MTTRFQIVLHFRSDFHVGTGAGRGRVVDAVVARDRAGRPVVPGSTLKGLAREQAEGLVRLAGVRWGEDAVASLFGTPGAKQGKLHFGTARPRKRWPEPITVGRSARDRERGRARDDTLFREELAAAQDLVADVHAPDGLSPAEAALLVASLRRIESLGRARSRGRGAVSLHVEMKDGVFQGAKVPEAPGSLQGELEYRLGLMETAPGSAVTTAAMEPLTGWAPVTNRPACSPIVLVGRAVDPLVLPASPETGNLTRSLGHVPGTSLRGAVAALALRAGWEPKGEPFQRIFVREEIAFGPLYPAIDPWGARRSLPFPAPLGLVTCKRHPGISGKGTAHGFVDLLSPGAIPDACGVDGCGGPLEPLGGVIQWEQSSVDGGPMVRSVDLERHVRMHVATEGGRAVEHELYAHEEVREDSLLVGLLWGDEVLLGMLRDLLAGAVLSVGKARSRGAGCLEVMPQETSEQVIGGHPPQEGSFTLTAYSDLIAMDALLRPILRLDEHALWRLVGGAADPPFALERGYARTRPVAGFNGLPGRPRTPDVALVAGSCWRYRWTDPNRRDDAQALLAAAESSGLGLRRGEGFGRIVVDHPLHTRVVDQTRSVNPTTPIAVWTAATPDPGRGGKRLAPGAPSPFDFGKPAKEDRDGLARLLNEAASAENPRLVLDRALAERGEREKADKGTDQFLRGLVEDGLDRRDSRQRLNATAEALLRGGGR